MTASQEHPRPSTKLNSWKEIARYLEREVRTVQRWEKTDGLPIRRLYHEKRGSVYAFTEDLDAWVDSRQAALRSEEVNSRPRLRLSIYATALACSFVLFLALTVHHRINSGLTNQSRERALMAVPPPAREAYLRGLYFLELQTGEGIHKSIPEFETALQEDPTLAASYARLAEAHTDLGLGGDANHEMAIARAMADRAMHLDSTSAEAHEARAVVYAYGDWNWKRAEAEYREALRLDPNLATTHSNYAQLNAILGEHDLAIAEARRAWELEPLSPTLGASLAWFYYWGHRFDEAIAISRKVLVSQPGFYSAQSCIVRALISQGHLEEARNELRQQFKAIHANGASAGLDAHSPQQAIRNYYSWKLEHLEDQANDGNYSSFDLALTFAELGQKTELINCLEQAYRHHEFVVLLINVEPFFEAYRTEPPLVDLVRKLNLPTVTPSRTVAAIGLFGPRDDPAHTMTTELIYEHTLSNLFASPFPEKNSVAGVDCHPSNHSFRIQRVLLSSPAIPNAAIGSLQN
jgi:tetratricopeptide (TPR) repeat protein